MARRLAFLTLAAAAASLVLTACQSAAPSPSPVPSEAGATSAAPVANATFNPSGSAQDNKAFFDKVNEETLAANDKASSKDLVNALSAAGFDKGAMQVTADKTPTGLDVDFVIVSVKMGNECLIGQRAVEGYASEVAPVLSTGECLIGQTQAIDW